MDISTRNEKLVKIASSVFVWSLIAGCLYLLSGFFLLIFLTFVFAYIQSRAVEQLKPFCSRRGIRVVFVGLVFLGMVVAGSFYLIPQFIKQGEVFASQFHVYVARLDVEFSKLSRQYPILQKLETQLVQTQSDAVDNLAVPPAAKSSASIAILEELLGFGEEQVGQENIKSILNTIRGVGTKVVAVIGTFLLSLLFSFLIVLDLPSLTRAITDLEFTKLGFIYNEVADSVKSFASVLGRALEAQFFIALCNTLLTAIGLYILGLEEKVAFLAVIVFLCSFVPVAGVFVSSIPICLYALQSAGFSTLFLAIGLITLIHMIEAYILNPRIYGSHMRMNPVIVLMILTIGGKLFQAWGLILGVPLCTYIFGYAIRWKEEEKS